jgi:hypothetical protein
LTILLLLFSACGQPTQQDTSQFFDTTAAAKGFVPEIIKKDTAVLNNIKAQKEYVALTDKAHLPESIMTYYASIVFFFYKNNLDKNNFYVLPNYIKDQDSIIIMEVCHYNGFKFEMELEKENIELNKNRKKDDPVIVKTVNGNMSGFDGYLEIDKATKKIKQYVLYH